MTSSLARDIADELSYISETKTIVFHDLTQSHYDDLYNHKSLAYNIANKLKSDSNFSLMTVDLAYFVFKNNQIGTYVIVSTIIDINFDEFIEVHCEYCEDSDDFARKIIEF